jgi:hypothetical protein
MRWAVFLGITTLACFHAAPPPRTTPIENHRALEQPSRDDVEHYACSISDGGYDYPAFPCEIRVERGSRVLEKLAGSQRFRGVVRTTGDGFSFEGEFFCPYGDCTKHLTGVFRSFGPGQYRGTFQDDPMVVTLLQVAPGMGGASYGGAAYGGGAYGGFGYGR